MNLKEGDDVEKFLIQFDAAVMELRQSYLSSGVNLQDLEIVHMLLKTVPPNLDHLQDILNSKDSREIMYC